MEEIKHFALNYRDFSDVRGILKILIPLLLIQSGEQRVSYYFNYRQSTSNLDWKLANPFPITK